MAITAGSILEDALTELGQLQINSATGGSPATIVDSDLGGTENDFSGGTGLIIRDLAGTSTLGQFGEVTSYSSGTGTLSFAAATFTQTIASGDIYGVSTGKDYPHHQMINAINRALQSLGDVPKVDTTTLDTASNKTEYTYAVAWKRQPPYQVDIQMVTTNANDNQWREINKGLWYYVPADAGSTGLIVFRDSLIASRDLRIWYRGPHDAVFDYDDVIYEGFHPEIVVWQTVYEALLWKNGQQPGNEGIIAQLNNAENKRIEARAENIVWKPRKKSNLLILSKIDDKEDKFTYPSTA